MRLAAEMGQYDGYSGYDKNCSLVVWVDVEDDVAEVDECKAELVIGVDVEDDVAKVDKCKAEHEGGHADAKRHL